MDEVERLNGNYSIMDKIVCGFLAGIGIVSALSLIYIDSLDQNKKQTLGSEKSQLVQKVQSPIQTPIVFRNDDGTTNTIYAHKDAQGQTYFDNNPSTDSLVERYDHDWG